MPGWLESAASTEARSIAWLKYRVSAPCSGSSAPGGGLISTIPGGSETAGVGVGGRAVLVGAAAGREGVGLLVTTGREQARLTRSSSTGSSLTGLLR